MWAVGRFRRMADFVAQARAIGFRQIEVNYQVTPEMLEQLIPLVREGAIEVSSLHNPCPSPSLKTDDGRTPSLSALEEVERKAAVELAHQTVDLAAHLGAGVVVIHSGGIETVVEMEKVLRRRYAANGKDEAYRQLKEQVIAARVEQQEPYLKATARSLAEVAAHAARQGVKLGLENRYTYAEIPSLEEMRALLAHLDDGVVYYWHDVGHAQALDNLGFVRHQEWLSALGSRLIGAHLHDIVGLSDHKAVGLGELDFAAILSHLPESALRVCEFASFNHPEEVRAGFHHLHKLGYF